MEDVSLGVVPVDHGRAQALTRLEEAPRPSKSKDPRSERPRPSVPDTDAMAVDALPDEVRLHSDPDETELSQPSIGGPEPESGDDSGGESSSDDR